MAPGKLARKTGSTNIYVFELIIMSQIGRQGAQSPGDRVACAQTKTRTHASHATLLTQLHHRDPNLSRIEDNSVQSNTKIV